MPCGSECEVKDVAPQIGHFCKTSKNDSIICNDKFRNHNFKPLLTRLTPISDFLSTAYHSKDQTKRQHLTMLNFIYSSSQNPDEV